MTDETGSVFGVDPGAVQEQDPAPEPGTIAEEMLGADERDVARDEQAEVVAEPETGEEAAAAESGDEDDGALPEFMTPEYLERNPDDAKRWSQLRGQARDFRSGLKSAQEIVAAREAQIAALEAQIEQAKVAQAQPAQAEQVEQRVADPVENPAEFAAQVQQQAAAQARTAELNVYERMAVEKHGADKVEEAFKQFEAAAVADPGLAAAVRGAVDPWAAMVSEMDRRTLLAEIGNDPAAYKNRLIAEAKAEASAAASADSEAAKAAAVEEALSTRKAIPSSLATAPGAGRNATAQQWSGPAPAGSVFGDSPLNQ